jgi:hypothetical protein
MVAWWWVPVAGIVGVIIVLFYGIIRSSDDFFDDGDF